MAIQPEVTVWQPEKRPDRPRRGRVCLYGVVFAGVLVHGTAGAAAGEMCRAQIEVKLTPDVPNPRDPSFLSALAANPLYQLLWIRGTDTTIVYELRGPATDYNCEGEIKLLKRDAHVQDLRVLGPDSQDGGNSASIVFSEGIGSLTCVNSNRGDAD